MRIYSLCIRIIVFILMSFLIIALPSWGNGEQKIEDESKPNVSLEISVLLGRPTLQLLCVATNKSNIDITTTEFQTNGHGIYFIFPDGKMRNMTIDDESPTVTIKPGKSMTWTIDLQKLMNSSLFISGKYYAFWKMKNFVSNQIPIYIEDKNK